MKKEKEVRKLGKLGESSMLNRRIGESENRRVFLIPRVAVSPLPRFLGVAAFTTLLLCLTFSLSHFLTFPAYAGLLEVSVSGEPWSLGEITADTEYTSDPSWTVHASSDGTEDISVMVFDAQGWTAGGASNGPDTYGLKETTVDPAHAITGENTKWKDDAAPGDHPFALWFKAPSSSSDLVVHTFTVTLTASDWKPWELNETNCNGLDGWTWLNGACWSDAIADYVSWNKGVGNTTSNTGTYTCNSAGTLKSRMEAAVVGNWSEICTEIDSVTITTADNGVPESCVTVISALAIADCVDGTRDIGPTITGSPDDWQGRSDVLDTWARAAGHSALPAVKHDGSSNEFNSACSGDFYKNTSTLSPGSNHCWAAACGYTHGDYWDYDTSARRLGYSSCSKQSFEYTGRVDSARSFRVVVRP